MMKMKQEAMKRPALFLPSFLPLPEWSSTMTDQLCTTLPVISPPPNTSPSSPPPPPPPPTAPSSSLSEHTDISRQRPDRPTNQPTDRQKRFSPPPPHHHKNNPTTSPHFTHDSQDKGLRKVIDVSLKATDRHIFGAIILHNDVWVRDMKLEFVRLGLGNILSLRLLSL